MEERERPIERLWQEVHHRDKVLQNHEKWYGECVGGFNASKSALKVRSRMMDKRERIATSREEMATRREKAVAIREKLVRIREEKVQKLEHELLNRDRQIRAQPLTGALRDF